MTPEQLNKAYSNVIKDMSSTPIAPVMASVGVSALSMIKKRVIETGVNAEGQKYPAYSTKPMLVGAKSFPFETVQKKVFSDESRKTLKWVTLGGNRYEQYLEASSSGNADLKRLAILPNGYKQWRELMGRQTDHVDFSVTRSMWNDISLISQAGDHIKGVAIIGAKDDIEKKKLEGNTKRKGDILDLNRNEIEKLKDIYSLGELRIFKNNGL